MSLDRLLRPRSVAIVGASADPKKISGMMVEFVRRSGFSGSVYPVNPRYPKIGEWDCYPSVEALPETVDVVVVVVPVAAAFDAVEQAAHRGVPFVVLMTGGFGEGRSGEEGERRLARLDALCAQTGLRVVGPNTVGMVNFRDRLPMTFADWYGRDTGLRGGVAILTHSGSVGGLIFSSLQIAGVGVDYWIATGNEANLEVADFIDHLSDDPELHTIACFMEGVGDGRRFLAACDKARARGKRVIVLKAGASAESRRATLAHTRKEPTDIEIYRAAFRRVGVVEVGSLSELTYTVKLLSALGPRAVGRIGILSASGGACSLIADHVVGAGLDLPELPDDLQTRLNDAIPEYGSSRNPVDLSADVVSRREILSHTLEAIAEDGSVDLWLVFGRPVIDRYHADLAAFAASSGKALVVSSGVPLTPEVAGSLDEADVAVLADPELCMRALGRVREAGSRDGAKAADWTRDVAIEERQAHPVDAGETTMRLRAVRDADFGAVLAVERLAGSSVEARAWCILPADAAHIDAALDRVAPGRGFEPEVRAQARAAALDLCGEAVA